MRDFVNGKKEGKTEQLTIINGFLVSNASPIAYRKESGKVVVATEIRGNDKTAARHRNFVQTLDNTKLTDKLPKFDYALFDKEKEEDDEKELQRLIFEEQIAEEMGDEVGELTIEAFQKIVEERLPEALKRNKS